MYRGRPNVVQNLTIALMIDGALRVRNWIASGNLVVEFKNLKFPDFVFGNGPTQSIKIRSNGSPTKLYYIRFHRWIEEMF